MVARQEDDRKRKDGESTASQRVETRKATEEENESQEDKTRQERGRRGEPVSRH